MGSIYDYNQFITYRLTQVPGKTKLQKQPYNVATGELNKGYHSGEGWLSFADACVLATQHGLGVGFVFTAQDPFFFIDLDQCATPDGQWNPFAQSVLQMFPGAWVEKSVSGTGLHIVGIGTPHDPNHRKRDDNRGLEIYTSDRFMALGTDAAGDSTLNFTGSLNALIATMPVSHRAQGSMVWKDEPDPLWHGPTDDDELIKRMLGARVSYDAAFGTKATIKQLWERDEAALALAFPGEDGKAFNWSSADAALVAHLAFWTGKNNLRMDRLFRRSKLYREDKWGKREDYRHDTIAGAVSMCTKVLGMGQTSQQQAAPAPPSQGAPDASAASLGIMYASEQPEHFKGCVYVRDAHRVFVPDTGELLKAEQFRAFYGGHDFIMDRTNKKTTKSAFECFTESQLIRFPKAHSSCFRPELEPGSLIEEDGLTLVNSYVPASVQITDGDVTPFLTLLRTLLPDPRDQQIILCYMAAVVQYPGVKFQWAPLIQGTRGNGKTFLIRCLCHAVGKQYYHLPSPKELAESGSKYNAWMYRKLFVAIEEIYVGDKREVADALKIMISNENMEFQAKGGNQFTGDNRANFMCATNHKAAVMMNKDERGWSIFYTAQQSYDDILKDGMGGTYFPDLYKWGREGGYAAVTGFLKRYQIADDFNPATFCHRGPTTSSTEQAISESLSPMEQEVLEVINSGSDAGFKGGYISSEALKKFLLNIRRNLSPRARNEVIENLGYIKHPGLRDGRIGSPILEEGNARPVLYVLKESIQTQMTDPVMIRNHYCQAQGYAGAGGLTRVATVSTLPTDGKAPPLP